MTEPQSNRRQEYWNKNRKLIMIMLVIWFVVSYLFGIILFHPLNAISLGGYKLGFWFAQQGSMYVFIALIFIYASKMNALDKEYDVHED